MLIASVKAKLKPSNALGKTNISPVCKTEATSSVVPLKEIRSDNLLRFINAFIIH